MTIQEHQTLDMENLISLRKFIPAMEMQGCVERLLSYIDSYGAKKVGGGVSATYAVDGDKIDMALYFPIDKEIPSTDEFLFKPKLRLENCLKITHKGNPQLMEEAVNKLNEHVIANNLTAISVGFIVTKKEIVNQQDLDLFEADVYISISPNIL